jgi:hypothetical protein
MNEQWVATGEDQWELRAADGRRLGSVVKLAPNDPDAECAWAALPRGGQYLQPQLQLRTAAEQLLERVRRPKEAAQ